MHACMHVRVHVLTDEWVYACMHARRRTFVAAPGVNVRKGMDLMVLRISNCSVRSAAPEGVLCSTATH